ncbi:hypothetical protein [Propionivibrio sp.]|uniref:hypothetical protein n=1 Tax=Propionivibrio sp. TaxID=2212460 RepID=UPI003BF15A9B
MNTGIFSMDAVAGNVHAPSMACLQAAWINDLQATRLKNGVLIGCPGCTIVERQLTRVAGLMVAT